MAKKEPTTVERTLRAPIEEVWELWTTREGIQSWWGTEGYAVKVRALDLRPGGLLEIESTATGPKQIEMALKFWMPVTVVLRFNYTEIDAPKVLAFRARVDYIQKVKPYDAVTKVELTPLGRATRLALTIGVMHDDTWNQRAVTNWEAQLAQLATKLGG
jgi:uncharacterized protein YndB with AHSA1/START domain